MPWWTWIALGTFVLAVLATSIFALWAFGRLQVIAGSGDALAVRLEDLSRQAEELQRRSERTSLGADQLQQRLNRIDRSVQDLGVLAWGVGGTRRRLMRARSYFRK